MDRLEPGGRESGLMEVFQKRQGWKKAPQGRREGEARSIDHCLGWCDAAFGETPDPPIPPPQQEVRGHAPSGRNRPGCQRTAWPRLP